MSTKKIIRLIPPLLSFEHIKEKIVCVRGHRERIFNVSTEIRDNKLVCHNYGQGGAGWTFLFGCVHESIRLFEEQIAQNKHLKNKEIAIIGAGCYGLLTAILLAYKGYAVRIIAKEINNIPSYKAAGFFFPRPRKVSNAQETAIFESHGIESYKAYQLIAQGKHQFITSGVKLLPAYFGLDIDPGFKPYIAQGLIDQPQNVTIDFGNNVTYDMTEYKILFINSAHIMDELHRMIAKLGIAIMQDEIESFGALKEDIIFNCTGLAAKKLTLDPRLIPVQGHLITLKNQPAIEHLQYMINVKVTMLNPLGNPRDELVYFAPKESGILGITFLRGQELSSNNHEFDRLLERCKLFFGS